uniref:Protein CDV3 homolog n=1 Tax=Anas zonorhyncha TaxID=75864 RepID=A0A8B9UYL1_9AVES
VKGGGSGIFFPVGSGAHRLICHGAVPSPLVFFVLSWLCSSSYGIKVVTYIFLFLQEEDDWKEFEQKEEIDYSGLRVQSMQISEKEEDESEKREEPGDNWEETGGGVDRSSGPWNKSAPAPAPVVE